MKTLKCKFLAHCTCALPLIDGLGYEYAVSTLVDRRESENGLATLVDNTSPLLCLLVLNGIYAERADQVEMSQRVYGLFRLISQHIISR